MTPLQRSAIRLARRDRRALHRRARQQERQRLRKLRHQTGPPRWLEQAFGALVVITWVVLLGLAARYALLFRHML